MKQPWKRTGKKSFSTPASKIKRSLTRRGDYFGDRDKWREFTAAVRARDGERCRKCGRSRKDLEPGETLEVHHMRHVSRGGEDHKLNAKTLCSRCHSREPGHAHLRKPKGKKKPKRKGSP